jgi:hypothetical protein
MVTSEAAITESLRSILRGQLGQLRLALTCGEWLWDGLRTRKAYTTASHALVMVGSQHRMLRARGIKSGQGTQAARNNSEGIITGVSIDKNNVIHAVIWMPK